MSSGPPLSRAAARVLADEPRGSGPAASERADAIAAIQRAMRASTMRRRRVRRASGIAAFVAGASALAAGAWLAVRPASPPPSVQAPRVPAPELLAQSVEGDVQREGASGARALEPGAFLHQGDVVEARAGRAMLLLATGTRVTLPSESVLAVVESGRAQIFELRRGGLRADVMKLAHGERFVVRTMDAEIEVRGTAFDVSEVAPDPACGGGTRTRVRVSEGVVVVRARGEETRVRAGERWPAGCAEETTVAPAPASAAIAAPAPTATTTAAPTATTTAAPAARTAATAAPTAPAAPATASAAAPASTTGAARSSALREQNDLFEDALAAKRRGDARGAIATLDRLLQRYPQSHLAESASAERMKLLATTDPVRAARAAEDYLARYPNGFARKDAEAIAASR